MGKVKRSFLFLLTAITLTGFLATKLFATAGQWSNSGSVIYYNDGYIGIGTSTPGALLETNGNSYTTSTETLRLSTAADRYWSFTSGKDTDTQSGNYGLTIGQPIYNGCAGCVGNLRIKPGKNTIFVQGNVGIGVAAPSSKLEVNGTIKAKQIIVTASGWADYVFSQDYKLKSLSEVEQFIKYNQHLPNVPSEEEIEKNGLTVGDMQKMQMEKIEELTLYLIQQDKKINDLEARISRLESLIVNK